MAEKKKTAAAPEVSDRKKALETAIAKIEKDYGKGTIMRLGDDISVNVEALSTGSLSLDFALGIGGVPKGRIIEIYGPEASGKTTLALHIVASAQKNGGTASSDPVVEMFRQPHRLLHRPSSAHPAHAGFALSLRVKMHSRLRSSSPAPTWPIS